jgi:hypothetical protein
MSVQSEELIPVRDMIEVACAVHREKGYTPKILNPHQKGYGNGQDNATAITNHFYGAGDPVMVTDFDKAQAEEVLEYFQGLGLKMMERDLSTFENQTLKFVCEEKLPLWKAGQAAVFPKIFEDQLKSDEWTELERELKDKSQFVGQVGAREDFTVLVRYTKYVKKSTYTFVVGTIGDNIVKFYLPEWLNLIPTVGRYLRVSAAPNRGDGHSVSTLTKTKVTKLCMVYTERNPPKKISVEVQL